MSLTKSEEIIEGSGWFKLRVDFDDKTQYEICNQSNLPIVAEFHFFDLQNITFQIGTTAIQIGDSAFQVVVAPNETATCVAVCSQDPNNEAWHYDYDLRVQPVQPQQTHQ